MKIGITIFLTDQTIGVVELAREVEARGFSSLWFPEHTHIPVSRRTPAPIGPGDLPTEYYRCLQLKVELFEVVGHTRNGAGALYGIVISEVENGILVKFSNHIHLAVAARGSHVLAEGIAIAAGGGASDRCKYLHGVVTGSRRHCAIFHLFVSRLHCWQVLLPLLKQGRHLGRQAAGYSISIKQLTVMEKCELFRATFGIGNQFHAANIWCKSRICGLHIQTGRLFGL